MMNGRMVASESSLLVRHADIRIVSVLNDLGKGFLGYVVSLQRWSEKDMVK